MLLKVTVLRILDTSAVRTEFTTMKWWQGVWHFFLEKTWLFSSLRIVFTKLAAKRPMWRFFRCLSSCTSCNSLEKMFSCSTACMLGNLEHSLISCLLICGRVCRGISARGRSVKNMILLIRNLLADSLIRLQNSEIKT